MSNSKIHRLCQQCGKEFAAWPYEVRKGKGRFCSRQCAYESPERRRPLVARDERFWSKVKKDGPVPEHRPELGPCWIWTARKTNAGYGQFFMPGKWRYAHRHSFQLTHGRPPEMCACHHCDNPACVRPEHLFDGSMGDNNADRDMKGRTRFPEGQPGDLHPQAKLNSAQVLEIRAIGETQTRSSVARRFGVSRRLIRKILIREVWGCI